MTLVAKVPRARRNRDAGRTAVSDGPQAGYGPQIGYGSQADVGGLAELWAMLAAAGVQEDEVLRALDGPGGTEKLLQRLVEAGLLPSQEESLAGLMATWKPLLKRGCDQWSAELVGVEFLAMMRAATATDDDVPDLLIDLISQAQEYGGPEALAMLRVLTVVGPARVRPVAAKAAERVASAGLQDRPWVKGLGAPGVGACFGYTDSHGVQEALAVTFAYGRNRHALAVLIDHELGGGIKDCWPTDSPDLIRADYQQVAKRYGLNFRDYEPAEARAILDRALVRPPCPIVPDQIEDVRYYLDLLRSRTVLLPRAGKAARGPSRIRPATTVHRVKVTLRGVRPPIWRRLEVPSGSTLHRLHQSIQAAFGWDNRHAWVFETPVGAYGVADRELGRRSAQCKRLADVAPRARDLIYYTYDVEGGRKHEILVEEVLTAEPGVAYPRCLAGRRARPTTADGLDGDAVNGAAVNGDAVNVDEVNKALSGWASVLVRG
jgi:hypothetical protein